MWSIWWLTIAAYGGDIRVPLEAPTLHDAVENVDDGGTIWIDPGDYSSEGAVEFTDKSIAIRGTGTPEDVVLPPLSVKDQARLDLESLALVGGELVQRRQRSRGWGNGPRNGPSTRSRP